VDTDYTTPKAIRRSAALHERVRAFARASEKERLVTPPGEDTFESLALDIAQFQYDYCAGFARAVAASGRPLQSLSDIPLVTTDAFRYGRVAVHPPELDQALYYTSGTTADPGRHPVRDLKTKEDLSIVQAAPALFSGQSRGIVVALATAPEEPARSSLAHMMELFMQHFDGRSLTPDPTGATFDSRASFRWLLSPSGVDLDALHRAARIAVHRSEPLYLLATSFALLSAIEELDGAKLRTPSRTTVMLTGGFKGARAEIDEAELRRLACRTFSIEPESVVGEYGMTELSSQLFERPGTGRYQAPPWLHVRALNPVTYEEVSPGEPGLAHFIDLANVDSSLSVLTQDQVRIHDDGIELMGRAPRATPRGCSLPYEGLIGRGLP
jgi:hypothetical protein